MFTTTMTDKELVSQARGVCQTWAELGSDADAELRGTQEVYGWTGEAEAAMFRASPGLSRCGVHHRGRMTPAQSRGRATQVAATAITVTAM